MHHFRAEVPQAHAAESANDVADGEQLDLVAVEIEEAQRQRITAVVGNAAHQLAFRAVLDVAIGHRALHLQFLARHRVADRTQRRFIVVTQRQMQHQIELAGNAELAEFLGDSLAQTR